MAGHWLGQGSEPMTQADLESFAVRLEWWSESLSERERALLTLLLAYDGSRPEEVEGYGVASGRQPISQLVRSRLTPLVAAGAADGVDQSGEGPQFNRRR